MKRTIAITLAALALTFTMAGCGGRNDGNVSDSSNGVVTNSDGRYQNNDTNRNTEAGSRKAGSNTEAGSNTRGNTDPAQNGGTNTDNGFMNDMENAVKDAGNAIGDAGKAVGDAITGNDGNSGTGMTGGR